MKKLKKSFSIDIVLNIILVCIIIFGISSSFYALKVGRSLWLDELGVKPIPVKNGVFNKE